jgi:N-acyl-phosphatidylethanolamine-hydrolysing phospholipase D
MGNFNSSIFSVRSLKKLGKLFCVFSILSCSYSTISSAGKSNHHTTTGFRNFPPVPSASSKRALFYLRRMWGSIFHPKVPLNHRLSEEKAINILNNLKEKNTLTWLGQSTFLLRINGKTILTDPFLTNRASPLAFIGGVTRYVPAGISIENLPPIDIILVSHNHYDHLDKRTIDALPDKQKIHIGVPLGLKKFFLKSGYIKIHELDWGESATIDEIQITALPAVHDSRRGIDDKDKTLWCSWGIISAFGKYYFAGDTGYSSIFQNIVEQYKSFNLAILPIGAYEPRELMWMSHVNPEEAIQIGMDINANVLVAGHWGTIEMSDEPHWEPPKRFSKAAESVGIDKDRIWIMKIGESRILP